MPSSEKVVDKAGEWFADGWGRSVDGGRFMKDDMGASAEVGKDVTVAIMLLRC